MKNPHYVQDEKVQRLELINDRAVAGKIAKVLIYNRYSDMSFIKSEKQ